MKILIIRHADPDYEIDGLTEVGKIEAELLKDRLVKEDITEVYCSTLGRAKLTIKPTLEAKNIEADYCEWLREFSYVHIEMPYERKYDAPWDILPQYMDEHPELYNAFEWQNSELIKDTNVYAEYQNVCAQFDKVLEKHGYKRNEINYTAIEPNHKTLVFVCHYGVASVLLSHIMNCSPYTIWQNGVLLPSSVTSVYTEERRKGLASLRVNAIGDLSHIYAGGREPSFAARFCECFTDNTRHD